jgi:hypothetical protein
MKKTNLGFVQAVVAAALAALILGGCDVLTGFANGEYDDFTGIFTTPIGNPGEVERPAPAPVNASDPSALDAAILEVAGNPEKAAELLNTFAEQFANATPGSDEAKNLAAAAVSLSLEASGLMNVVLGSTDIIAGLIGGEGDIESALGGLLESLSDVDSATVGEAFEKMLTNGKPDGEVSTKVTAAALEDLINSGASPDNVALAGVTLLLGLLKDGEGHMINPLDEDGPDKLVEKLMGDENPDNFVNLFTVLLGGEPAEGTSTDITENVDKIKEDLLAALFGEDPSYWSNGLPRALAETASKHNGDNDGGATAIQNAIMGQLGSVLQGAATAATEGTPEGKVQSVETLAAVLSAVPDVVLSADTKLGLVLVLASAGMGDGGMIGGSMAGVIGDVFGGSE